MLWNQLPLVADCFSLGLGEPKSEKSGETGVESAGEAEPRLDDDLDLAVPVDGVGDMGPRDGMPSCRIASPSVALPAPPPPARGPPRFSLSYPPGETGLSGAAVVECGRNGGRGASIGGVVACTELR